MELTQEQYNSLKPYEKILSKFGFSPDRKGYLNRVKKEELLDRYAGITGSRNCGGCSSDNWVKRLSTWYDKAKKKYDGKDTAHQPVIKHAEMVKIAEKLYHEDTGKVMRHLNSRERVNAMEKYMSLVTEGRMPKSNTILEEIDPAVAQVNSKPVASTEQTEIMTPSESIESIVPVESDVSAKVNPSKRKPMSDEQKKKISDAMRAKREAKKSEKK